MIMQHRRSTTLDDSSLLTCNIACNFAYLQLGILAKLQAVSYLQLVAPTRGRSISALEWTGKQKPQEAAPKYQCWRARLVKFLQIERRYK